MKIKCVKEKIAMRDIKITYSRERWEDLSRRAREKIQNAAELAKASAEKMGEKAEELRAQARLEKEIHDLQEEINLQMQTIGEVVYAAHKDNASDSGCVQQILEYVDGLYEQLDAHRQELDAARGQVICAACGVGNDPGYLYCQNCGQPLSQ